MPASVLAFLTPSAPLFAPRASARALTSRPSRFATRAPAAAPCVAAPCHPGRVPPARRTPRASAKTQQEAEWNPVTVIDIKPVCEAHILLTINVGITYELGSMTDSYREPGMFVQLRPTDADERGIRPGFFAISSPPTISGLFEFLIKTGDSTAWIEALKPGDRIQSSAVMGKGFRFSGLSTPPEDVLLFATGSGIAPIRAAIESVLNGVEPKKRRSVTLFYGARNPQRMAYMDRFDEWRDSNVNVIPVISRPDQANEEWAGDTGYVQDVLAKHPPTDPKSTAAILCGVKGMAEDVRTFLTDAGVPEDNILLNF